MIKLIFKIACLLAVVLVFWIVAGNMAVSALSKKVVGLSGQYMSELGVTVDALVLGDSSFSFPVAASWENVGLRVNLNENSAVARKAGFLVSAASAEFNLSSWFLDRWEVDLKNMKFRGLFVEYPLDGPEIGQLWLSISHLRKMVQVSLASPRESIRQEYKGLVELMRIGRMDDSLKIEGAFGLTIDNTPVVVNFHSEVRDGGTGLRANLEDIRQLANLYSLALTEAELEVVSKYPLQSPAMFRLHRYAMSRATEAYDRDRSVPQDAYRHLLWSFMLTNKFGERLAEEITDAHEIGSLTNTEADHRMDYHNNQLGRKYAVEGRREKDILYLVKNDPEVVQFPH